MTCKCCKINEADKKNTHYLTDAIIRKCLNEDGTNYREKGFMFELSNKSPFIEFNFQRETKDTSILEALGREPTDEEINEAKKNAFSVDNFFCTTCENSFSSIENEFIEQILPKIRGINFEELNQEFIQFEECKTIRKFFLLQYWRTSICDPAFDISTNFQTKLYNAIFIDDNLIGEIPLKIIHLNTLGDDYEYTKNLVGTITEKSSYTIFFNDFIIQAFENIESINYIELYGLNSRENHTSSFNTNEQKFNIEIIFNDRRVDFTSKLYKIDLVNNTINFYQYIFVGHFLETFGRTPHPRLTANFIQGIIYGTDCTEKKRYSIERFQTYANDYFKRLINYG